MKEKKYGLIILCGFLLYAFLPLRAGKRVGQGSDIVSVIKHGIRNDGAVIGSELNELVTRSYGKTLYFPAGIYKSVGTRCPSLRLYEEREHPL
mgnify:CR=1 FL=1